ncbi:MAG: hypothetical protein ABIH42_11115, partial [Planctomycetota bacterium]
MKRFGLLFIIVAILIAYSVAFAQESNEVNEQRETEHTVYIPYRDIDKVFEQSGRGVFLPYEQFIKLWRQAKEAEKERATSPVSVLITSASYECVVGEEIATVSSVFSIDVLGKGWVELPISLTNVALQ